MKIKTKHIITCIKCLFLGLVMALPFIAVLPTALYYGFNEHAISGDKVEYIPTNKVNTIDDLIVGNEYYNNGINTLDLTNLIANWIVHKYQENFEMVFKGKLIQAYKQYAIDVIYIEPENTTYAQTYFTYAYDYDNGGEYYNYAEVNYKLIYNDTNYNHLTEYFIENYACEKTFIMTEEILDILIDQNFSPNGTNIEGIIKECPQEYRTIKSIETNISNQNALEIAFNNVFTTKGFNWVSNSIIATPVYAFVGAFGLTNDLFLSNLIVYWTNILLIYAILNIVIVCFTKLTTLGQKKDKD